MNIVNSISDIRNEMYMLGGSFVQQLATLMRVADYENSAKLIAAFPDIFERYDAHVSVAKKSSEMTTEDEADQAAKLKTQNRTTMNVIQSEISRLRAENAELITALSDCVAVMENELSGLTVIQPELRQAKTALSRRLTDEASAHFMRATPSPHVPPRFFLETTTGQTWEWRNGKMTTDGEDSIFQSPSEILECLDIIEMDEDFRRVRTVLRRHRRRKG